MSLKDELANIISSECFFDDSDTLDTYSKDLSFVKPNKPQAVVKPKSTDDVQAIVKWANQTGTPLIPVSSGPPHFHGDTVPSVPGVVIVDLSGMKQIINIDRRNRIAMFEAGITYPEIQPELTKAGLRLTMPLMPRPNKSVVASLLEREPTLIPGQLWSSLDPLRCTSIIWGDGQKLVTGDAGNWPSIEVARERKQAAAGPTGPGQTDFYRLVSGAQGSMGIVTWISAKCEVLPEIHKLYFAPAQKLDDLTGFIYQLLKFRFGDEILLLNNASLAYILGDGTDQIKTLMKTLPPWTTLVGIAGRSILPKERVECLEKDIADFARSLNLQLTPTIPGVENGQMLETLLSPSKEPYWRLGYKAGYQDIFFLTTLNRTPEFVSTMNSVAEANGYPTSDIGVYIQPMHQGVSCHCEFILPFDRDNQGEANKMQQLLTRASEELLKQGAFFSRPYGIWADMAYKKDMQTMTVLKKVKGIFDPNSIMNPGKLCF